jgi:hypothetical protein
MKLQMNWMKVALFGLTLAAVPSLFGQTTGTTTLGVTIAPEANITSISNPTLTHTGTTFASFTGDTTFTYFVRTTESGGSGSVTAKVTTPFDEASGITTADLSEVASKVGAGSANTTSHTASESAAVNVLTFAGGDHSADSGDVGTISWTLADRPAYKTGGYSAIVTLTISAS